MARIESDDGDSRKEACVQWNSPDISCMSNGKMRKTFQVLEAGNECLGMEFGELERQSFDLSTLSEDLDQDRRSRLGINDEV